MPGLTLTRRAGERVIITAPDGATIAVTLAGICGPEASINFVAPPDYDIDREEVAEAIETGETVAEVRDRWRGVR